MLILRSNKKFEKNLERMIKRGKDKSKFLLILELLLTEQSLPLKCRPHKLTGQWIPFWECHIEPDWLLIYHYDGQHLELVTTGTHSDLF